MRRMNSIDDSVRAIRVGWVALVFAVASLGAYSAGAVPANFDSTGTGFIPSTALMALPTLDIDISTPFLTSGDPSGGGSFEIDFSGSAEGQVCILANAASTACQANLAGVTGPYSAIVTLEISALNSSQIDGPFTLLLTQLDLGASGGDVYAANEVSIALDPMAPMPLDTMAVPGFNFDGSFDPFVRVEDSACMNSGGLCSYLGWTIDGALVGETVTFRFDMSTAPAGRNSPKLLFNAVPVVVPEPGTALLMALGLAGLASIGPRRTVGPRRG